MRRALVSALVLGLVLLAGRAMARDLMMEAVPLPRPKPFGLRISQGARLPVPRPALPGVSLATGEAERRPLPDLIEPPPEPSACQLRLRQVAAAVPLEPLTGPGACGAVDVVRLEAIVSRDGSRIAVEPPATLRCEMAEAVAYWVRDDVGPVAARLGAPLAGIENFDSYDCRGRNRVAGATISEHGKANALDIRALKLAGQRPVELTDPKVARPVREALRQSACARFSTVLGPGSDGYHESHVHVDLAERRGGLRYCQWDVRDPAVLAAIPLPRARPPQAPARAPASAVEVEEGPE